MTSKPSLLRHKTKRTSSKSHQWPIVRIHRTIGLLLSVGTNGLKSIQIFVLLCSLLFIPVTGHAQQEVLLISGSVTQIVENLKNTIHGTISALDTSYSNSAFRTRQHLQILLNQLETVAENVSASTFSDLSSVEQEFFTDLTVQVDSLRTLEKITLNDAEMITRSMSSAIRNLPFSDNVPIVFHYEPLYIVNRNEDSQSEISVTVTGALLSSGEPSLTLDGTKCRRDGKIHTALTFICVSKPLAIGDSIENLKGRLELYEEKSIWDHILFRDHEKYSYDIFVSVLPRRLGTVTTRITYEMTTLKKKMRTQKFSDWNNHCAGARHKLFEFNVMSGWTIDVDSINVIRCSGGKKSRCNGLRHISENAFAYSCHLENNGICIWPAKDARGHCGGKVVWYEVASDIIRKRDLLPEVEIYWGEDALIPLREGTKSVEMSLVKADGERRIFTKSDGSDSWVDVAIELVNGRAIISPKELDVAMK